MSQVSASTRASANPYAYDPAAVEEPPRSIAGALRRIGPGMLLTAAIVGTGELIATTRLGADVGFVMLWAILGSCLIKTVVQAVWGRYTIVTGETAMSAMNHVPGPRLLGVNWLCWSWAAMTLLAISLIGAMYAGAAQVMARAVPGIPLGVWVVALAGLTLFALLGGTYRRIERMTVWMVATFTLMTVFAAGVLTGYPEYFTWRAAGEGLLFGLPEEGIVIAIAVFGITGVNSGELFAYPYWCVEKGYARFTGPRENSEAWRRRAAGWIRVMHFDILVSMLVYTLATVAFYFLGAGVLHTLGRIPEGDETIQVLSAMYSETMGEFGLYLFYVGALFVLYSTIFSATAANSRIFADLARLAGAFGQDDHASRVRWQNLLIVGLTLIPCAVYFGTGEPVQMVKAGGIVLALMLPVIAVSVVYLRHRRLPQDVVPGPLVTATLWLVSALTVVTMSAFALMQLGVLAR